MSLQRQFGFWVAALVALIALLWLLSDILLPFIAGLVLAYFLDPVADALERLGLPRLAATLVILILSVLGLTIILVLLLPVLGEQIVSFAKNLPGYITSLMKLFNEIAPQWVKELLADSTGTIPNSMSDLAGRIAVWIAGLLGSIWSGGLALVNLLSLLIVTPIVAFYLLNDWDRMVAKVDSWLPRHQLETIRDLARQMDEAMAGFIRGQGTVCLTLGIFYAVGLTLAGLNFGLLIGLGAGLLSFIPFVGTILGGVTAVGMALIQFWPDWVSIVVVFAIFAAGQFIEGNFLSPKLVGDRVGLHPVWLMFALFAFGYIFGFVGLLLAVPLAAAAGVLIRFALKQYLEESALSERPRSEEARFARAMTSSRGRQLILDLPLRPALGREDFLVGSSNAEAVAYIDRWPSWPASVVALVGPPGSGKTHLAEVWRRMSNAQIVAAASLLEADVPSLLESGALVIEDAPCPRAGERTLFHLLNLAREQKSYLLMTSREPPSTWRLDLPDLISRLKAVPVATLGLPGDDLLRGVIVKLFADRQIAVDEALVSYLMTRMPRALAAARALVAEIDRRALEEKAEVTRHLVARVLASIPEPGLFAGDGG